MASETENSNEYQPINSPFKWAGGKSRMRKQIVQLLPLHSCYVEPFAGAGWVLFAKPPSDVEVLNDIDGELINFFSVVRDRPEELIASFDLALVSRAVFEDLASRDTSSMTEVERAHRFYYLIMAGWGGESNYPRFQTSISDGGHGNRLIGALKTLRKRIDPVHDRLKTVIIENLSWEKCVDRYDNEKTVMYLDPPYPGNGINYKFNMRSWEEHQALANRLAQARCKWILSSYDTPEIRDLYGGLKVYTIEAYSGMRVSRTSTKRVINKEVLITNFDTESAMKVQPLQKGFSFSEAK
ncbi:MAG: DNA adenine methylase [Chloroflexota bacterium]